MEVFWKAVGCSFVSVLLSLTVEKQGKDFSILITLASASVLAVTAARFIEPVVDFLTSLEKLGKMSTTLLTVLIKIMGIGITGEISASVCMDAGNTAVAKGLHFLTNAAIFSLSIPVYSSLVELIQNILGGI